MTDESGHHHHHHETPDWQSLAKISILAGLGIYFGYNILTGNLANYINARFAWLSYMATVLFLMLAIAALYSWLQNRKHDHSHHDHHDHHHDHNHGQVSRWILFVTAFPLMLGFLIPSQPLGAEAVEGNIRISAATINTTDVFIDPLERNILDWLRAFNDSNNLATFNDQQARVIGFVYREVNFPEDHFMIVRFAVSCCVADSSAIGLPVFVNGIDIDHITEGSWISVDGYFELGEFEGQSMPILNLSAIEEIEQPANPYINP